MHLIKLALLASLASVAFSQCVRQANDCPPGTHAENEPEICRDMGYPPQYHLLCVGGDLARFRSRDRWFPRGSSRRPSFRQPMCGFSGDACDYPFDCCTGQCSASTYTCN